MLKRRSITPVLLLGFAIFLCSCEQKSAQSYAQQETHHSVPIKLLPEIPIITGTLDVMATKEPTNTLAPTPTVSPTPTESLDQVTVLAVGDDLMHQKVINSGLQKDNSYNYKHLFSGLKEEFKAADLAIINQETILGPPELKYSGYPRFCAPFALGEAIVDAGFDVVLHANNHVMDRGIQGIEATLNFWSQYPEITPLGIHATQDDNSHITVIEKKHIKIAMLNYTYGMNGFTLPSGKEYMVNTINEKKILEDIKNAKDVSDFIIVFLHWGSEYQYTENQNQKALAKKCAQAGADLLIGTHPHVLQPVEWITADNKNRMLCYYSLGNYVSSMDYTDRVLGGMAKLTIEKQGDQCCIKEEELIPIVTHYERGGDHNFLVCRLSDYTKQQAEKHYILGNDCGKDFSMERMQQLVEQIIGDDWKNGN